MVSNTDYQLSHATNPNKDIEIPQKYYVNPDKRDEIYKNYYRIPSKSEMNDPQRYLEGSIK